MLFRSHADRLRESETINVIASATGNASHTPVILKRYESRNTLAIITTKPRIIEMINAGAITFIVSLSFLVGIKKKNDL